jgi:hypothetical protein
MYDFYKKYSFSQDASSKAGVARFLCGLLLHILKTGFERFLCGLMNKGNNKITELRSIY